MAARTIIVSTIPYDMPSAEKSRRRTFSRPPLGLKKWLKIPENQQILPEHIESIKSKIRVSISVEGDYEYASVATFPKKILLRYENGHYSFVRNPRITEKIVKKWKQGKRLVMFQIFEDYILTYDGVDLVADSTMTADNLGISKDFIFKQFDKKNLSPATKKKLQDLEGDEYAELLGNSMADFYESVMTNCVALKEFGIDFSDHRFSVKDTAISLFSRYSKAHEFYPIEDEELVWIEGCKNHGLLYAKEQTGHFRNIDGNSWYPALMRDPKLLLPLGKPEYRIIENFGDFVQFGIYRCVITGADLLLLLLLCGKMSGSQSSGHGC